MVLIKVLLLRIFFAALRYGTERELPAEQPFWKHHNSTQQDLHPEEILHIKHYRLELKTLPYKVTRTAVLVESASAYLLIAGALITRLVAYRDQACEG